MIITRLEEDKQSKIKVYIDDEYAFFLYRKEMDELHFTEGMELPDQLYEEIIEDIVSYRAREKVLAILRSMDRTEQELRRKLMEAGYTQDIADRAIAYAASYGYVNDERYASSYIRSRMKSKSKLTIRSGLLQKGVDREIIEKVFLEEYEAQEGEDSEAEAILKAIAKKTKTPESLSYEEKQKLIAALYRKGFDLNKINRLLP